jgi:hypothetical protein
VVDGDVRPVGARRPGGRLQRRAAGDLLSAGPPHDQQACGNLRTNLVLLKALRDEVATLIASQARVRKDRRRRPLAAEGPPGVSSGAARCITVRTVGGHERPPGAEDMTLIPGHEVHGSRLVGRLPSADMVDLWTRVSSGIVKHGFVLEYRDLEAPRTGIFNGLRIVIDPDVGFEMQCFLLLHLFGHSVQWVAPALEHKLDALQNTSERPRFMRVLHAYELEAAALGMQLMHERGVTGLDQWYSDFVETDWRYVERYYQTGQLPRWEDCVVAGQAPIQPIPIPVLKHHEVEVRFAF